MTNEEKMQTISVRLAALDEKIAPDTDPNDPWAVGASIVYGGIAVHKHERHRFKVAFFEALRVYHLSDAAPLIAALDKAFPTEF